MSEFEGTTLALQHYYDITGVAMKLPLLTLYHANEQPFGRRMAVWMETDPYARPLPAAVRDRLEAALLKNRAIRVPHALRILDFGSGEGHGFVVTDDVTGDSLRTWLDKYGPLKAWQFLRLAEQLTAIVSSAHEAEFHELCLTTQNIFITDNERFDITTAPLGIGLRRREILSIQDLPVVPDLVRHLPPWAFETLPTSESDGDAGADDRSDSIQDLDSHLDEAQDNAANVDVISPSDALETTANSDLDADVYNVAAILYEAMAGQHPYFGTQRELCDAVAMMQAPVQPLSEVSSFPKEVCDAVMGILETPRPGSLVPFLSTVSTAFDAPVRQEALHAEKTYFKAPKLDLTHRRPVHVRKTRSWPRPVTIAVTVVLMLLTACVTHHFSAKRHPIDLFALPELIPTASEGVDIVIPLPRGEKEVTVFLSSLADGSLIRLGTLPLIFRNQTPSSRLNFVLQFEENEKTKQLPVVVRDTPGLQIVPSE